MNPDWTIAITEWPEDMKTQLKEYLELFTSGYSRFNELTVDEICVGGSRYYGGFNNISTNFKKISDLDIQIYVNESGVAFGDGFTHHGIHLSFTVRTKPLSGNGTIWKLGSLQRPEGYNLPVYSLTNEVGYGELDEELNPDIEAWRTRND